MVNGRIRLHEADAVWLYWLLQKERVAVLRLRRSAKEHGEDLKPYQHQTARIRIIRSEIERTAEELGWDLGVSPRFIFEEER